MSDSEKVTSPNPNLVSELSTILDDYFENDTNLQKEYEAERPITDLYTLPLVKQLDPPIGTSLEAIKSCKKLVMNSDSTKVRTKRALSRTILILRDLPDQVGHEHIKKLFEEPELAKQIGRVKEIRPELNNAWFVRFSNEDDCVTAAMWLNQNGTIQGQKVRCRVKSVLPSSIYNPNSNAGVSNPGYQNDNYFDPRKMQPNYSPNFYGGYPPSSNFMGGFMGNPYAPQARRGGYNKQRRRNSGGPRRNSGRRGQNGRGNGGGYRKSPGLKGRKPQKTPPAQANANDNVFYEGQYVLIGRPTFDAVVKQSANTNSEEPTVPEKLAAFAQLMTENPGRGFDLQPLTVGNTISPMPVPMRPSNSGKVPELSLGEAHTSQDSESKQDDSNLPTKIEDSSEERKEEEETSQVLEAAI